MELFLIFHVALLFVLVGLSAFFSGSETAFFSLDRLQLQEMLDDEAKNANLVKRLQSKPKRLLVTILLGNELVNVVIVSVVTTIVHYLRWTEDLLQMSLVSSVTAALVLLIFGEITPKSVAVMLPQKYTAFAARPLLWFYALATPLRETMVRIIEFLMFIMGENVSAKQDEKIKEEEFRSLVDTSSAEGAINEEERVLIHRVFRFDDQPVGRVMKPLSQIFALSYNLSPKQMLERAREEKYSRIPIYRRRMDKIIGVLHVKDLLPLAHNPDKLHLTRIDQLISPPLFVPRSTRANRLLQQMRKRRTHMAFVVDEYSRTVGVVTMEDLLEQIVGKIVDEKETHEFANGFHETEKIEAMVDDVFDEKGDGND